MFNLVSTASEPVNLNVHQNAYNELYQENINEVLCDTLTRLSQVTGLSKMEAIDMLHAQLIKSKQSHMKNNVTQLQNENTTQKPLLASAEQLFISSLFN
jgi:hypothetical protein